MTFSRNLGLGCLALLLVFGSQRTGWSDIESRTRLGLVIGINEYQNWPILKNAVIDAETVAAVLKADYAFSSVRLLEDEAATEKGIIEAFKSLIEELEGDEDVLVYFAGHGKVDSVLDRGYWIPHDAADESDYLPNSDLVDFIKAMDNKDVGHVLVISDSCFSGALVEGSERGVAPPAGPTDYRRFQFSERVEDIGATPCLVR